MFNFFKSKPKEKETESSSSLKPLAKYYVFNETGNIMLCTTQSGEEKVHADTQQMFAEVSVFFSALAKAITDSSDGHGNRLTMYNYDALKRVLNASGMFMEVGQRSFTFSSQNVGRVIQKEIMQTILGREFEENTLNFALGLLQSMGKQAEAQGENATNNRAGSIFFICEELLGMPTVSVVVIKLESDWSSEDKYDEPASLSNIVTMDDLTHHNQGKHRDWKIKKRTYLFMPPKLIQSHVGGLTGQEDYNFQALVSKLKEDVVVSND